MTSRSSSRFNPLKPFNQKCCGLLVTVKTERCRCWQYWSRVLKRKSRVQHRPRWRPRRDVVYYPNVTGVFFYPDINSGCLFLWQVERFFTVLTFWQGFCLSWQQLRLLLLWHYWQEQQVVAGAFVSIDMNILFIVSHYLHLEDHLLTLNAVSAHRHGKKLVFLRECVGQSKILSWHHLSNLNGFSSSFCWVCVGGVTRTEVR